LGERIVPKPVIDEYRKILRGLRESGKFSKEKHMAEARSIAQSRLITARGIRWFNLFHDQIASELNQVLSDIEKGE